MLLLLLLGVFLRELVNYVADDCAEVGIFGLCFFVFSLDTNIEGNIIKVYLRELVNII